MKKSVLIILLIFSIGFVSASYECSTTFEEALKEIDVGNVKTTNGIRIGILDSIEIGVINKISAELLVDAKEVILTNETPNKNIELKSGDYDVDMINITDEGATIEVESDKEEIIVGEWTDISTIYAMLVSTQGNYPGQGEITIMIGTKKIGLSNIDNPEQLVTIDNREYLIELASASSSGAIINVKTCSGNIIEVVVETTETNDTIVNETTETNDTIVEEIEENTTKTSEEINANNEIINNEESRGLFPYQIPLFVQISLFIVVIIVFILYFKNRSNKKNKHNVESKDESKEEPKDESKEEPKDESKEEPKDESKD